MSDGDDSRKNSDDGFAISEDLIQSPTHKQATTNSIDFDGLLQARPLKLHEDLAGGNGGQAWPAGRILAKYLLRQRQDELKGKTMSVLILSNISLCVSAPPRVAES